VTPTLPGAGRRSNRARRFLSIPRIDHANVGFFLQTYAHVLGNDDRDAAEQAAAFLLGNPETVAKAKQDD
jgi:hypothetical protein